MRIILREFRFSAATLGDGERKRASEGGRRILKMHSLWKSRPHFKNFRLEPRARILGRVLLECNLAIDLISIIPADNQI